MSTAVRDRDQLLALAHDDTVTVGEVAEVLDVSISTARWFANHGQIQHVRTGGGHRRFLMSDVRQLMKHHAATATIEAILPSQIRVGAPNDCWPWTARSDRAGYGTLRWQKKDWRAHRLTYEMLVGPIPDELVIDHLCRNPPCCNPAHLEPVTNGVNVLRGISPIAENAKKTHCKQGHRLDGANLRYRPNGRRSCVTCQKLAKARFRERARLAVGGAE